MSTRRRHTGASSSDSAATQLPTATQPTPAATAHVKKGVPRWFRIYYSIVCTLAFVAVGVYLLFFRMPPSHTSYDPIRSLPPMLRTDITHWYHTHNSSTVVLTPTGESAPIADLMSFLSRFERAGYFSSDSIHAFEHYMECMVSGWIAGVFESVTLDEARMAELEAERKGVGSIPGGSRRLKEKMEKLVSPIVRLMYEGDAAAHAAGMEATQATGRSVSHFASLHPDHANWVYEGLSHCHTTPCRLAKMQLMSLWQDRVQLYPEHEKKDEWNLLTQLFHPDTHPDKLIDAPASATTLGSLWMRFFASGRIEYLRRVMELTKLTGAAAYQNEKDREIREWRERQERRAEEARVEAEADAAATAAKTGQPMVPPTPTPRMAPLPASPTAELHTYFFNSLLFYAPNHPSVKKAVHQAWTLDPNNSVIQLLMQTTPFRIQTDSKSK